MALAVLAWRTRTSGNRTPWPLRVEGRECSGDLAGSLRVEAVPRGGAWGKEETGENVGAVVDHVTSGAWST